MRRLEAIRIIDELGDSCKFLNPRAIFLEQTADAGHYEIHVEANVDDDIWECLKKIAKEHALEVKLMDHKLIIYRPLNKKSS